MIRESKVFLILIFPIKLAKRLTFISLPGFGNITGLSHLYLNFNFLISTKMVWQATQKATRLKDFLNNCNLNNLTS